MLAFANCAVQNLAYLCKRLRLRSNISITTGVDLSTRRGTPYGARPVAAKCDIENLFTVSCIPAPERVKTHDPHIPELRIEVTPSPVRLRLSPTIRIRIPVPDILRHIPCREVPNLDAVTSPQGSVDAASVGVEGSAVAGGMVAFDAAAYEAAACAAVSIPDGAAGLAARADVYVATGRCVQSHVVIVVDVYAFEDVELALIGPVGADHPAVGCCISAQLQYGYREALQCRP